MAYSLTRILATIGPASESPETITRLAESGMNACRLNFSHGSHEEHAERIRRIRSAAESVGNPIPIVMDLCGPKVRTDNQSYQLSSGELWTLRPGDGDPDQRVIGVQHPTLHTLVPAGARILLDDGHFELVVREVRPDSLLCECRDSGTLKPRKAVNTPGIDNGLDVLSPKDQDDLTFGRSAGVDWVAISFVRNAEDVRRVRRYCQQLRWDVPLIAKIETPLAVANLEEIVQETEGVMVARGDLGIECPMEEIPLLQKRILQLARKYSRLSIVATQMLESMVSSPRPTRAEVTDVAHAVFEGSQVVMLSGETAAGRYPVETVKTMARILRSAEEDLCKVPERPMDLEPRSEMLWAAVKVQSRIQAAGIVVVADTLDDIARAASLRGRVPVIAVCREAAVLRRASLYFGIQPMPLELPRNVEVEELVAATTWQLGVRHIGSPGDIFMMVHGGNTVIRIVEIGAVDRLG